jgi:hypothetical protein
MRNVSLRLYVKEVSSSFASRIRLPRLFCLYLNEIFHFILEHVSQDKRLETAEKIIMGP